MRTREKLVNHEPKASDLQALRVTINHRFLTNQTVRTILVIYINNNIITLLVLQGARDIFEVITESKESDTAQGMPLLQIDRFE